jgi:protein phosphatase
MAAPAVQSGVGKPENHRDAAAIGRGRPLGVRSYGLTHPGRARKTNEDQFLAAVLAPVLRVRYSSLPQEKYWCGSERGYLFAVADGISGQPGGEEASSLAVSLAEQFLLHELPRYLGQEETAGREVLLCLRQAFQRADAAVCAQADLHPALAGMGSTLTVAYSAGTDLFVAHAGDSRGYLCRAGRLHRLTGDHTVEDWLARHRLRPRYRVGGGAPRRLLTNVVGGPDPGVKPELRRVRLRIGDVLLLCTDGLTGTVPERAIAEVLARQPDLRQAAEQLVSLANEQGGKDNVTAVLARFGPARPRR